MIKRFLGFYKLPMYILVHPVDGFYNMKFQKEGTTRLAIFNFFLVCVSSAFMNQYTSLRVVPTHPLSGNSLYLFISFSIALLFFCTSNWAVSSISDGEGRFKDILMVCGYSMTPIILTYIPVTIFSNALAARESGFYFMIINIAVGYSLLLGFIGLIIVHNYTVVKAIINIFLTIIALLVIIFLLTLFMSMWTQLWVFVQSLYLEITFRS